MGEVAVTRTGAYGLSIDLGGQLMPATVVAGDGIVDVRMAGQSWTLGTRPPRTKDAGGGHAHMIAPMPGRVLAVDVTPGQAVAEGDRLSGAAPAWGVEPGVQPGRRGLQALLGG